MHARTHVCFQHLHGHGYHIFAKSLVQKGPSFRFVQVSYGITEAIMGLKHAISHHVEWVGLRLVWQTEKQATRKETVSQEDFTLQCQTRHNRQHCISTYQNSSSDTSHDRLVRRAHEAIPVGRRRMGIDGRQDAFVHEIFDDNGGTSGTPYYGSTYLVVVALRR